MYRRSRWNIMGNPLCNLLMQFMKFLHESSLRDVESSVGDRERSQPPICTVYYQLRVWNHHPQAWLFKEKVFVIRQDMGPRYTIVVVPCRFSLQDLCEEMHSSHPMMNFPRLSCNNGEHNLNGIHLWNKCKGLIVVYDLYLWESFLYDLCFVLTYKSICYYICSINPLALNKFPTKG